MQVYTRMMQAMIPVVVADLRPGDKRLKSDKHQLNYHGGAFFTRDSLRSSGLQWSCVCPMLLLLQLTSRSRPRNKMRNKRAKPRPRTKRRESLLGVPLLGVCGAEVRSVGGVFALSPTKEEKSDSSEHRFEPVNFARTDVVKPKP